MGSQSRARRWRAGGRKLYMETKSARRFAPTHLGAIAVLSALLSMAGFAILVSPANAKPEYLDAFNHKYNTRGS